MNRPNPYKEYLRLEPLPLPPDPPELEVAAVAAVDALASPAEPAPGALTPRASPACSAGGPWSPTRARFPAATSTIQQPQPR